MKRYSISSVIREIQNYSIIIGYLKISVVAEDGEQFEPSYTAVGSVNWCSHFGKEFGIDKVEDRQFHPRYVP